MNAHVVLSLFHIFAVVPLFLFVALSRTNTPHYLYTTFLVLGLVILVYHGWKAMRRFLIGSSALWINLIHVLFVAPLLLFIGYKGKDTPRYAYELLALIAFAALGYHAYALILELNLVTEEIKK
jgi:glucose uptake protein GlcU